MGNELSDFQLKSFWGKKKIACEIISRDIFQKNMGLKNLIDSAVNFEEKKIKFNFYENPKEERHKFKDSMSKIISDRYERSLVRYLEIITGNDEIINLEGYKVPEYLAEEKELLRKGFIIHLRKEIKENIFY